MSQKLTPFLRSLKSLPVGYRFDGSRVSDYLENSSGASVCLTNSSIPRKGGLKNGINRTDIAVGDSEDSPYSGHNISIEEQSFSGDLEDPGAATSPLPQNDERRWSDTSAYARKKIPQSWIQLPNGNWELGKILSTSGDETSGDAGGFNKFRRRRWI